MAYRITQEDLEKSLGEILGEAENRIPGGRNSIFAGIAVVAGVALTVAYFLGRRVGRLNSTTVEIRRI
ncbi:MAG: Uncharacterised protein [Acidimicrobiales bacterium AG-410-I20]|nr:MAG: Uncharacterised protein [Acidimicrobiales bacterium AG-410-I20]